MKARGRATGVASGARAGDPHGKHLYPKWSSVPPDHLGQFKVRNMIFLPNKGMHKPPSRLAKLANARRSRDARCPQAIGLAK